MLKNVDLLEETCGNKRRHDKVSQKREFIYVKNSGGYAEKGIVGGNKSVV